MTFIDANQQVGTESAEKEIAAVYRTLLKREPDTEGLNHWKALVANGGTIDDVRLAIEGSPEYEIKNTVHPVPEYLIALHHARVEMVRQLPKAQQILDLGGGAIEEPRGALVMMGYPYAFEELHIIEPPPQARHEIYQNIPDLSKVVPTHLGPVRYHYGSMVDLSRFPDESFDLVMSGETIEHVTVDECKKMLVEIRRVMKPTGSFCFDTPNRTVTEIQCPNGFINPEHKVEYRHSEMLQLLAEAHLIPVEMKGVSYMPETVKQNRFLEEEILSNKGLYADLENCYLLYYRCVRSERTTTNQ
jgi:SAM-dependent methyltransferase